MTRNANNAIRLSVMQGSTFWMYLQFSATDHVPLSTGSYTSATESDSTKFNGFDVYGSLGSCGSVTGRFWVREVSYDGNGNVTRFAADFEQHCNNLTPALFGAVRYNSTVASLVPFDGAYPTYSLTVLPADHGRVTGDGIDCSVSMPSCTRNYTGPSALALTASPDDGFRLISWWGDCQGGDVTVVDINGPRVCMPVFGPITPAVARSSLVFDSLDTPPAPQLTREWVGRGEEWRYSDLTGRFRIIPTYSDNSVTFLLDGSDGGFWSLDLRAPDGGPLVPGTYENATRAAVSAPGAGLDFSGNGHGCNSVTGRFVVYDSAFDNRGNVTAFAADFEQHCEGYSLPLYGAIRYHSTAPDVIPFGGNYSVYRLHVLPPSYGRISGGPLDCAVVDDSVCSAGFSSADSVSLTAAPAGGYLFTQWSGACSGTSLSTTVTVDARHLTCGAVFTPFHLVSFGASTAPVRPLNPVTWTAVTSPPSGIEFEFWRYDSGIGWRLVHPYSANASYSWTPASTDVGSHSIQVWLRAVGSTARYDDWRSVTFDVLPPIAPSVKSLTADHAYPLPAGGGAVTWTATVSSGSSTPEYEFWRLDADGWHMVQGYSATNTYTWTPTVADVGSRTIQVWVRNAGSTANYEAWQGTSFNVIIPALTITSLSANNTPSIGVTTTWTAQASGGIAPLTFQFWRLDADGWHVVQDYSTTPSYSWTPALADAGSHALQVWVKSAGSVATYDAWRGVSFSVPVPAAPSVTIAALGAVPAAGQGSITWKATASGGIIPYQYRFWRLDADGWHIGQDYSASDTYTWSPGLGDAGTHAVQVWMRIAGSSANYDAWISTGYFVVPSAPPVTVSFGTAPALPATAGTPLTWTATTSTPNVEYEVWRYDQGTGWQIVQAYGASATYTWIPDVSDAGTHALQVWVRRVGSSATYDGWIGTGYFTINALN